MSGCRQLYFVTTISIVYKIPVSLTKSVCNCGWMSVARVSASFLLEAPRQIVKIRATVLSCICVLYRVIDNVIL